MLADPQLNAATRSEIEALLEKRHGRAQVPASGSDQDAWWKHPMGIAGALLFLIGAYFLIGDPSAPEGRGVLDRSRALSTSIACISARRQQSSARSSWPLPGDPAVEVVFDA